MLIVQCQSSEKAPSLFSPIQAKKKKRNKTKVNIGQAFEHGSLLKKAKGFRSQTEVTAFFLNRKAKQFANAFVLADVANGLKTVQLMVGRRVDAGECPTYWLGGFKLVAIFFKTLNRLPGQDNSLNNINPLEVQRVSNVLHTTDKITVQTPRSRNISSFYPEGYHGYNRKIVGSGESGQRLPFAFCSVNQALFSR